MAVNRPCYVSGNGTNTVSAVDPVSFAVTTITVNIGSNPGPIAYTPDYSQLYVCNTASANISVINTATNIATLISTPTFEPQSVAVTPNGKKAVFVCSGPGVGGPLTGAHAMVVDTGTNTVDHTLNITQGLISSTPPSSAQGIAISADSTTAYMLGIQGDSGGNSGVLSFYNIAGNTNTNLDVPTQIYRNLVLSLDGKTLFVSGDATTTVGNGLATIDVASKTQTSFTAYPPANVAGPASYSILSPDGKTLYVADQGQVLVFFPTSSTPPPLTHVVAVPGNAIFLPAVTHDGKKVFFPDLSPATRTMILDTTSFTITTELVSMRSACASLSVNGDQVWIGTEAGDADISVSATATNTLIAPPPIMPTGKDSIYLTAAFVGIVPSAPPSPIAFPLPHLFIPRKGITYSPTDINIDFRAIQRWANSFTPRNQNLFIPRPQPRTQQDFRINWLTIEVFANTVIVPIAQAAGLNHPILSIPRKDFIVDDDLTANFLAIENWANSL